jgi:hypothetical protein
MITLDGCFDSASRDSRPLARFLWITLQKLKNALFLT